MRPAGKKRILRGRGAHWGVLLLRVEGLLGMRRYDSKGILAAVHLRWPDFGVYFQAQFAEVSGVTWCE